MKTPWLKKLPVPISGTMLGVASLGNLLQSFGEIYHTICSIIAAFLMLLLLVKLIIYPAEIRKSMADPIQSAVAGTFPMTVMVLSVCLCPLSQALGLVIWIIGILLHLILIVYYSRRFLRTMPVSKLLASCFVVYVGIAAAAITARQFDQVLPGIITLCFGAAAFVALLGPVTFRYWKYRDVPGPARPLICIYAAPASLCLTGYLNMELPISFPVLIFLFVASEVIYLFALSRLPGLLENGFSPAWSAMTFPLVISAIAAKKTLMAGIGLGHAMTGMNALVIVETLIAVLITAIVLGGYIRFLFKR